MRRIIKAALLSSTLLLAFIAPSAADEAKQPAPAAAPAGDGQELQPSTEAGGCPADGKCCGSAACAEAKTQPLKDGEAAAHDCPCRRNKNKPQHNH